MYSINHIVNGYTYAIMGVSLVGAVFAKRFAFEPTTFIFAFLAAPTMAFIQKKEADTLYFSEFSKYECINIGAIPPLSFNVILCSTNRTSRCRKKSIHKSPMLRKESDYWRSMLTAARFDRNV
jgi:hypothetical protein